MTLLISGFDKFLGYKYRTKIKVDTHKTIKDGLKCAVSYLDFVSKDNKHDILITLGEREKLSYLWDYNKDWEKYKEQLIILDEFCLDGYSISIPVPKDIGIAIYYVYYNTNIPKEKNQNYEEGEE